MMFVFTELNASTSLGNPKHLQSMQNNLQALSDVPAVSQYKTPQDIITFNPPYRGYKTSQKDRVTYTSDWLYDLSNAGYSSFVEWYFGLENWNLALKVKYRFNKSKKFTYLKLKEKITEWEDVTYTDIDGINRMYEKFITAKNTHQLLSTSFPTEQFWWGLGKMEDDGPGFPKMALDVDTVRQFIYERNNARELKSLSLCFLPPKYSALLFFTLGKCGKSVLREDLWKLVNPINLIKASAI